MFGCRPDIVNRSHSYAVSGFTAGLATFHGRQLAAIGRDVIQAGKIPPVIFVGIDNGSSARESNNPGLDRANEYLPCPDSSLEPPVR